jgi:GT2 family glycosyltransferase
MTFHVIDLEVSGSLEAVRVPTASTGIAFLVRRASRPIAFWMEDHSSGDLITVDVLVARIALHAGHRLLAAALREEALPYPALDRLPSLTIAICTRNRPDQLRQCVQALQKYVLGQSITSDVEILVVDNASTDERTRAVAGSLGVRYAYEPKPGLDFARNLALELTASELLAFLDDDVIVDRGWLAGLGEALSEHPDAAAVTGLVLPYRLETAAQILFERRGGFGLGFEKARYGPIGPDPSSSCNPALFGVGANMMFRTGVLRRLGGFDEALDTGPPLAGGGDLDIFYRLIRADHPLIYEPRMLVFHQHRTDLRALRRQYWSWGQSFMALLDKCYRTDPSQRHKIRHLIGRWSLYQLRLVLRSLLRHDLVGLQMTLIEICGAIAGLCGEYRRSGRRVAGIRARCG